MILIDWCLTPTLAIPWREQILYIRLLLFFLFYFYKSKKIILFQ